jgi:hypothetical protein
MIKMNARREFIRTIDEDIIQPLAAAAFQINALRKVEADASTKAALAAVGEAVTGVIDQLRDLIARYQ